MMMVVIIIIIITLLPSWHFGKNQPGSHHLKLRRWLVQVDGNEGCAPSSRTWVGAKTG